MDAYCPNHMPEYAAMYLQRCRDPHSRYRLVVQEYSLYYVRTPVFMTP